MNFILFERGVAECLNVITRGLAIQDTALVHTTT